MLLTEAAPYGIINFDALWWVVIAVTLTVVVAFYLITFALTKPLKGSDDSIFVRKASYYRRSEFISSLNHLEKDLNEGLLTLEEAAEEIHDIMVKFLQIKTRTDITGYTYAQLSEGGAPEDLLEAISQSYHILYAPIADAEKRYRINELLTVAKRVVMRWR